MTIQQAYQQVLLQLFDVCDDREAANIANMVIEHFTGQKKIDRIINKDLPVTTEQQRALETAGQQLARHKPVQYVLNEAWFYGIHFYVNENVLIPRPETEELVEWVVQDMQKQHSAISILDVGTGSGCIPIALKKQLPGATIAAVDVSAEALQVAKQNAASNEADIDFHQLNILDTDEWKQLQVYDAIVSNPPYIKANEQEQMNQNVLAYEPHLALFVPDDNALIFYEAIAEFGKQHLQEKGRLYFEINEQLGEQVVQLLQAKGYKDVVLKKDMQGKDRMVRCEK
ncbi:peptide chain release factor N(5)-glutamine methyltransferase [Aridibaculum aurantiacum]|uniref:peptide chain release factor N(5)-glutamine methyltransferase n=1 Tax=Aridibaculum aurantiacum TaxID=2810307 RepID=UPI001A970F6E